MLSLVGHFLNENVLDPYNLFRNCRKKGIKDPRCMTKDKLVAEVEINTNELELLVKKSSISCHARLKSYAKAA